MAHEVEILRAILGKAPRRHARGVVGPGDDACVLPPSLLDGSNLLLSCDALEEGVHFLDGWMSPEDLAHKLLAVGLSDLAAMGAEPCGVLACVAWRTSLPAQDAARFGAALEAACATWACPLLGGDTDVREAPLRLEATVLGRSTRPVLRSGGRGGDSLFVTGPLGGAALAVRAWSSGAPLRVDDPAEAHALRCFRRPVPRLDIARLMPTLAAVGALGAAIDLSDGLRQDASRLAAACGLSARLHAGAIPLHPALAGCGTPHAPVPSGDVDALAPGGGVEVLAPGGGMDALALALDGGMDALALALDGGEDYELLLAGAPSLIDALPGLVRVGELVDGEPGRVDLD